MSARPFTVAQTESEFSYRYRMSVMVRVILYIFMMLIPGFVVQEVWMLSHHMISPWELAMQVPLVPVFVGLIAWTTAWSIASADCVAEGMLCTRVIGAKVFIPWGQVRQFKRSVRSVHIFEKVLRICILRTDDRIPFCFHLHKDEMPRFVAILREHSDARIIGFDETSG